MSAPVYHVRYSESLELSAGFLLDQFEFPWLEIPTPATEFRAVWNRDWFGFRFDVVDRDIVCPDHAAEEDPVLSSDRVELFFASDDLLQSYYYGLEMDPKGRLYDYRATSYRQIDAGFQFPGLTIDSEIDKQGYRVSGRIDLKVLTDLDLLKGDRLRVGVYRAEFSHLVDSEEIDRQWISWIDPRTPQPDFHVPASFGTFILSE